MLYNDGYAPLLGQRHPAALGRPFGEVWPDLVETMGPALDRAYAGDAVSADEITFVMQPGDDLEGVHFAFSCTPIIVGDEEVAGLICLGAKTRAQMLAEKHMRFRLELDERLRHLADPREVMAVAAEMLGRHLRASRANYGYISDTPAGEIFTVERDWTDGQTPSLVGQYRVDDFGEPLIRELKQGNTVCLHDAFNDEMTAGAGIAATYVAIGARSGITVPLIKGGRAAAALLVHQVEPRQWREDEEVLTRQVAERTWDAVERALAEMALRRSEARSRDILESINDAFYAVDHEWRFTYVNRRTEEFWGRKREELMGRVLWEAFPEAAAGETHRAHVTAMEGGRPIQLEAPSPFDQRWLDISIFPKADKGLSVYFRDITERKRVEAHRELLLNELNHRVKNTLATVQSIAIQTLRNADVAGDARNSLESRLFALSRAHDILTQRHWEGAALAQIVAQALEPYRGEREKRLHSEGPDINLAPRAALAIAMALQELATNAVKYGALSNETGEVFIRWSLDDAAEPSLLTLTWEERGGPTVQPPQRRGFGSRLIERSLVQDLHGGAKIEFAPTGVVCAVDIPLPVAKAGLSLLDEKGQGFSPSA
ncbi:sensor histidine kinase [Microvirga terricola]|uniref:Blue-light-activated histidine kinase n=1 Tax=Microvirga terricola TaxID=2719797 RepID=A0ABX0V9L7_9HYPH|nr:HWE histidine kinase domain-containing protein [Microvirga terricola]NIX76372.1 PAS domain-containing protein [Microvirga terricola]